MAILVALLFAFPSASSAEDASPAAAAGVATAAPAFERAPLLLSGTVADVAESVAERLTAGTLLFSKGDCLYVTAFTGSEYTHVGVVVEDAAGARSVVDSMKGHGVRRSTVAGYLASMQDAEVLIYQPQAVLDETQRQTLDRYTASELGRPYGVSHYLTGQPAEGVHCSEFASSSLRAAGLVRVNRPSDLSPGSLLRGVSRAGRWQLAATLQLSMPEAIKPSDLSCCESFWWDTKKCCRDTGDWFSGLFLCR